MLIKQIINEEYKKIIQESLSKMKQQYEDLMLDMLHAHIDNITQNFITAKRIVETIENIEKAEQELNKLLKEKEEGEKENGKKTELNA